MYKSIIKIICLLIVISFGWVEILAIGQTFTHFHDIERSKNNSFQVGTLDLFLTVISEEDENNENEKTIEIRNKGNLSFQYTISVERVFGDKAFCNALNLEAELEYELEDELEDEEKVNLMNFNYIIREFDQDDIDVWEFEVSLPDNDSFIGQRCEFKFVFEAWQINLDKKQGFSDIEKQCIIVRSSY